MTREFNQEYSVDYLNTVFAIWYSNNRPNLGVLHSLIPPDENGNTPNTDSLSNWKKKYSWDDRADRNDIEVSAKTDKELIESRIAMMKRQAQQAREIAKKAYDFLTSEEGGFDSSASAVTAWQKAVDIEQRTEGMSIALTKIYALSDDDLKKELDHMLNRLTNVGEITGDENIVVEGEVDAISPEEAINE